MKIAVFSTHQDPCSGGGYTFEAAVLSALRSAQSSHSFVVLDLSGRLIERIPSWSTTLACQEQVASSSASSITRVLDHVIQPIPFPLCSSQSSARVNSGAEEQPVDHQAVLSSFQLEFLWFPVPACLESRLPFAITVWDLEHRSQPFFPEVSLSGWSWDERENFYRRFLPRAAAVVVGTEVGKSQVVRFYGVDPARVIVNPFPVPPDCLVSEPTSRVLDEAESSHVRALRPRAYFLYPAQYWPHKNHANLLLAMAHLRDVHGLEPSLVLTGADKGNQKYISSLITNLGLEANVRQLGFVSRDDLSRLYANAFALVYPSFFGPDNLPPLEAFAHHCPVLAADGDGPREQLGDAALYFDAANPFEIASCMLSLLRNPDLRSDLVLNGLRLCPLRTADIYVARMLAFFDRFEAVRCTWPAGYVHS